MDAAEQERQLTALRGEFDFIGERCCGQQSRTLRALDKAFGRAFANSGGWPNFKRKGGTEATLREEGDETVVNYTAKASVGGKIAQLGSRLIDGTAKNLSGKFFAKFKEAVEGN